MSASDLAIVAALIFAWGTMSARLERFGVTAPGSVRPCRFAADPRPAGALRTAPTWNLVGVHSGRIHHDSDIGMVRKRRALEEIIAAGQPPSDLTVAPLVGDPIADSGSGTPAQ